MKMPEPIGYLSQYNLTMLEQGYPQTIVMLKGEKRNLPIYNKQALIDLLEAAAVECENRADELNTHLEKQIYGYAVVSAKDFTAGAISASKRNAAAIRKLKELL